MKEVNKELYLKLILGVVLLMLVPFLVFASKKNDKLLEVFYETAKDKVNEIINLNGDKELVCNETYDKFVYLAFRKDEKLSSFFVDSKTGEEKDFTNYIKEDKKDEYNAKINELLNLKYPKFIVDVLAVEENKTYEVYKNKVIIHYSNEGIEPKIEEDLSLKVNYNEIKDCVDFSVTIDKTYENEDGYNYDPNKKAIAFTFDDGPNGAKTNKIVSLLNQNKAHATFFMVGNRMEYGKETILNVLKYGNEIGSHSYNHKNLKRTKLEDIVSGEEKTNEIFYSITGQNLTLLRPPYGNVTKDIKEALNITFINWNLDTEDWLHRDKKHIVDYVMANASDGDIILMHDLYDSTVDAVEELLPLLYANGFQVVSVSELAKINGITLEPHTLYRSLKKVQ